MSNIAASIITIGDELLIGQVIDTNSAWIAQKLNALGIDVLRRVAVGDNAADITSALTGEMARATLIIITGGLGPTADDITKPLLNEYFGGKMITDARVLEHIKAMFARRNRPFLERNMKQAEVPDSCTVLFNKMGTAPGMWFGKGDKVVIALPGVPFEMKSIMEEEALPRLRQRFISDAILHRSIITAGEGESFIADKIQDLEEALPSYIKLAYLPGAGMVRLRLTGRGADPIRLGAELQMRQEEIAGRLGKIVLSLEDLPLEHILGQWFTAHSATLSLAESCTGGFIAHHITQVMGSSVYFKGGIVCYQPEVKEVLLGVKKETINNFGVVSEQTAVEMAQGALKAMKSDYALAITGYLSPTHENGATEPGTVWMAAADHHETATKMLRLHYDRAQNKELAVSMALLMIWKFITRSS